jgi:hypothetical protein
MNEGSNPFASTNMKASPQIPAPCLLAEPFPYIRNSYLVMPDPIPILLALLSVLHGWGTNST